MIACDLFCDIYNCRSLFFICYMFFYKQAEIRNAWIWLKTKNTISLEYVYIVFILDKEIKNLNITLWNGPVFIF